MDTGVSMKETVVNVPVSSNTLELFSSSELKDFESYVFLDKNGQLRNLFSSANYEIEMHLPDPLNSIELSDCSLHPGEDYYLNVECSSIPSELTVENGNVDPFSAKSNAGLSPLKSTPLGSLTNISTSPVSCSSSSNADSVSNHTNALRDESLSSSANLKIDNHLLNSIKKLKKSPNVTKKVGAKIIVASPKKNGTVKKETISNEPLFSIIPSSVKSKGLKKITKVTPVNSLINKRVVLQAKKVFSQNKDSSEEPMSIVTVSSNEENNPVDVKIDIHRIEEVRNKINQLVEASNVKSQDPSLKEGPNDKNLGKSMKCATTTETGDEKPVTEALERMGISDEELNQLQMEVGNQRVWFCPQTGCLYNASKLNWLKTHLLTHFGVRPYKCDHENCSWSFFSLVKLKRHKETHLKKKSYECDLCGRFFTTVYNLHTHLKLHKRPADIYCPVVECQAAFQTKRSLELHLRVHKDIPAPYYCELKGCGKRYYSRNALRSHSRGHVYSEEDLKCSFCSKMFDKPCRLKAHMRSHTGVKPYRCKFEGCSWAFTTSSKLTRHMCKHTNIRKYPCNIDNCGKSFLRSEHLRDHVLTHYTAKSFNCPVATCSYAFSARSSLYVHLKKVHKDGEKEKSANADNLNSHSCDFKGCDYSFSSEEDLKSHLLNQHVFSVECKSLNDSLTVAQFPKNEVADISSIDPLDPLSLIGNDENLSSLNSLSCTNDETSISGINLNLGPEGLSVSLPELVSNNSDFNAMPSSFSQSLTSEKMLDDAREVELKPLALNETTSSSNFEAVQKKSSKSTSNSKMDPVLGASINISCARTNLTLKDVRKRVSKKKCGAGGRFKKQNSNLMGCTKVEPESLSRTVFISSQEVIPPCLQTSDVVLQSSWLDDNLSPLMLQDDLNSGAALYETNHDEGTLMGASSNELQVFLLDSNASSRHCEFEQSTINLRDLE